MTDPSNSIRVLHIIGTLGIGGAETAMARLCAASQGKGLDHHVLVLGGSGPIEADLRAADVQVCCLRRSVTELFRLVDFGHPQVIQGWMYHGSLAATALHAFLPRPCSLVWNIRTGIKNHGGFKQLTRMIIGLLGRLSRRPDAIVYNAASARKGHEAAGYLQDRGKVIPNGFDLTRFKPDSKARQDIREELGLSSKIQLVGLVARVHPVKNPELFLRAIACQETTVHALLAGSGANLGNFWLKTVIESLGLQNRVHLLGERRDIPKVMAALDVAVSASWNEGFSNSLGEAQACGIPCVATDVGDSAALMGGLGLVVPPGDQAAMSAAIRSLLLLTSDARAILGEQLQSRMSNFYSLSIAARRYQDLYRCLAGRL